jgi:DNA-binding transcriptional ArsR family regulator
VASEGSPAKYPGEVKWSAGVMGEGFVQIPSLLLRHAGDLSIGPAQLAVLVALVDRWIIPDTPPVVRKEEIARQLGISARQVQRHIRDLRDLGLIETRFPRRPGFNAHQYTFSGLRKKLIALGQGARKRKKWQNYRMEKGADF